MSNFSGLAGLRMLLVVCCAFALSACSVHVATYNEKPRTVWVDAEAKAKAVNRAMVLTFMGSGWTVIERTSNQVTATLDHRGFDATVAMRREGEWITISVKSSESNFNVGDGPRVRYVIPARWLKKLQKTLQGHVVLLMANM